MDKIMVNGLRVYGYHGVNEDEKQKGQPFVIDLIAYADIEKACKSDNVEDTVSYAKIIKTIKACFNQHNFDLLEALAQFLCDKLFEDFEMIEQLQICITKPRAPILADFDSVAVEIFRARPF